MFAFILVIEALILFGNEVGFFDEVLAICGIIFILYGAIKKDFTSIWALIFFFLIGILGLIPQVYMHYERGLVLQILDFFLTFKFAFWFFGFYVFFKMFRHKIQFVKITNLHNKVAVILLTLLTIFISYSRFVDGVSRVSLLTGFNGTLANFILVLQLFNLIYTLFINKNYLGKSIILNLLCVYSILLTDSSSVIIISVISLILFLFLYFKIKLRYSIIPILITFIVFIYLFVDKIQLYFLSNDTARSALYFNSIKLAILYFPFGVGLSLYGTAVAGNYYSPLYIDLNFTNIYGLGINENFLNDSFYPGILAEFGVIGALLFVLILLLMTTKFIKKNDINSLFFAFSLIFPILVLNISFNSVNSLTMYLTFFIIFVLYYRVYSTICVKKQPTSKSMFDGVNL